MWTQDTESDDLSKTESEYDNYHHYYLMHHILYEMWVFKCLPPTTISNLMTY